ncbi:MAG: hypothetical protein INH41_22660 [Myxococcaceae bacterium]|nr:hypothetical protein [Myxococcaceae bacterium]
MRARAEAFVTLVAGDAYARWYRQHVFPSHQRFARLHGRPLVVLEGRLPPCGVDHPHPSWDKLRVFEASQTRPYERLCWLDADLFTMRGAPDPFAQVDEGWLAVDNDTYGVPAQATQDREWSWFLPPPEVPPWLVNTGFFVVERERHGGLFGNVFRHWGGRWDQGPCSFHLHGCRPGTKAPAVFNRVVLHHLARFGHGPASLRTLVDPPGFIHFVGASVVKSPVYLRFVAAADDGDARAQRRLEALQLETVVSWGVKRRLLDGAARVSERLPGVAGALARHRLARALQRTPRLLVSPHRSVADGWVSVDVASRAGLEEKFSRGLLSPIGDAAEALAQGRALDEVRLEHVLERLDAPLRPAVLEAAARALAPGGRLTVLAATFVVDAPAAFAATANRRLHLGATALADAAAAAGLSGARVEGEGARLGEGPGAPRAPRSHQVLTWRRPR